MTDERTLFDVSIVAMILVVAAGARGELAGTLWFVAISVVMRLVRPKQIPTAVSFAARD